jgi:hypothetical protein
MQKFFQPSGESWHDKCSRMALKEQAYPGFATTGLCLNGVVVFDGGRHERIPRGVQ